MQEKNERLFFSLDGKQSGQDSSQTILLLYNYKYYGNITNFAKNR